MASETAYVLTNMIKSIEEKESPFILIMVDHYLELPSQHKEQMLIYFNSLDIADWGKWLENDTDWVTCWGNICYYFASGREDIKTEPCLSQFRDFIRDYVKSPQCKKAQKDFEIGKEGSKVDFTILLEGA
jgi:hypothetical protein